MFIINNIFLIGNLVKDSELKYAKGTGNPFLTMNLAVARGFKKEDGTDFINVVIFGNLAEKLAEFYTKGLRVCVAGKLRIDSNKNEDGSYSTFVKVIATETKALGNKKTDNEDFVEPVDNGDSPF